MKKLLRILAYILGFILLAGFIAWLVLNEKEPTGQPGPAADQMAERMMASVDKTAWDSTRWVAWDFAGQHNYLWDKTRNLVRVRWDMNEVLLNTKTISGKAYHGGEPASNENDLIQTAWGFFCNDSYWLNPVVKTFDPGTERSIVQVDGRDALKVQYTSGGVTPGDSYVWFLDENGRPEAWKMWVKIIPIGGIHNSWEGWQKLSTGAWVATTHTFFGKPVDMLSNVKAGMDITDFGISEDPFAMILE